MSESEMTNDQYVEAIYAFAAEQMHKGATPANIKASLIEKGLDAESAGAVVRNLLDARRNANKSAANKNMLVGALWCIGGIVVTALTYSAASNGGGRYVVAWGAVVFGAIQFFRGLAQSFSD